MTPDEAATALVAWASGQGWAALVVFFRAGAAMTFLPAFGASTVSTRIRLALAIAFTAIVAPAVADDIPVAGSRSGAFGILLAEVVAGLALGFSVRLMTWILQIAGTIAGQATSLAQLLGADAAEPQPAIGQVLLVSALALAAIAGLHVRIAEALILSYDPLPAGVLPLASETARWSIARVRDTFGTAFSFGAPFMIASLIYNVALGVINRAMPQLMVAFVGAPAITAGGLILLTFAAPLILALWSDALHTLLAAPFATRP
ncbi:MAG: flagellar biosynthetic protein FliR [Qingshengfaniella sp.]